MKILILGGTRFLGRALAEAAIARGDRVTLFHRGSTGPGLFPGLEHILGDRERDLDRLDGRTWDAVFDTCGFVPRIVRLSADRLAGRVAHYSFISSISVYAEPLPRGSAEDARVGTLADESVEQITGETYGPLKALCERAAEAALPGRVLNARAGLLVGPHDYTDRFPYWVDRIVRGGNVLVPDAADQPLQLIDARDAAAWLLCASERGTVGACHLTGPAEPLTLGGFFELCRRTVASEARFIPVAAEFLLERDVQPWSELPLWTPGEIGMMDLSLERARAQRLEWRPVAETIADTLAWWRADGAAAARGSSLSASPPRASLAPERERELLEQWAAR